MPALTSQSLVLGLALILTVAGLVGLAPNVFQLFRRRKLLSQLANLKVDEEAAQALFSPVLKAGAKYTSPEAEDTNLPIAPLISELADRSFVPTGPAPTVRLVPASPSRETLGGVEGSAEGAPELLVGAMEGEVEAENEEEPADTPETPPAGEDDFMAMFKETAVVSSVAAVLTESIEVVQAADLLEQARALRDLLRRAA
jgi:hypothetical protein